MRVIKTYHHLWQAACWECAEKREPFSVDHLQSADAAYLALLSRQFAQPVAWNEDKTTFYFMPPVTVPSQPQI